MLNKIKVFSREKIDVLFLLSDSIDNGTSNMLGVFDKNGDFTDMGLKDEQIKSMVEEDDDID